ncbi:hypothetical protein [Ornithinimicrobium cerasi]|uniref:Uncharacterized protein n=1 Tax=Ornithinimicrobium cerasi TaxID=2248773 RepID=A0A285VQ55_9MICO|nr:hypothetical protein [Ornithinimicrobium cerasi]SOC56027.1 hypothetical protein SAMN05421879_106167 [Ornithinimicrobium cerasi]
MLRAAGDDAPDSARSRGRTGSRELPWRRVAWTLAVLSLLLVLLSLAVPPALGLPYDDYDHWLRDFLDVGREGNVPTWWSSSLHLLAAGALTVVALVHRQAGRGTGAAWAFFALLHLAFSADEATLIHDRARRLTTLVAPDHPFGDGYAWLGVGIPLGIAVLVAAVLAARGLPALPRRLVLLGLGVFFLGAVGFEILHAAVAPYLEVGFTWVAIYHVEELLEMWGVVIVLAGALTGVRHRPAGATVVLEPTAGS